MTPTPDFLDTKPHRRRRVGRRFATAVFAVIAVSGALPVLAQVPTQGFSVLGSIESLTLDDPGNPLSGGKARVNGQEIVLPANLLITMPGQYLTLNDLFRGPHPGSGATLAAVGTSSGLALRDTPRPVLPFEIQATGNISDGQYIAGVVKIVQQDLMIASGFIRRIDPATGELLVGAERLPTEDAATAAARDAAATRVRLNDPEGTFGRTNAQQAGGGADPMDERFSLDPDNAPVAAETGFPVCIPRSAADAACPVTNRPGPASPIGRRFTCGPTAAEPNAPALPGCEPRRMVPLREGDYVDVAGMLTETAPGSASFFVAAHALAAHLGIYTSAGADPAYVFIEESISGMLGEPFPNVDQEETSRFRTVGFTTDPSRDVDVFAMDIAADGTETPRLLTTLRPQRAGQIGRVRITLPAKSNFLPVTREVRYRIVGPRSPGQADSGTYTAPVGEYIFPENTRFGQFPPVSVPFENFCVLKNGGGQLLTLGRTAGPPIGPLLPFPGSGHAQAQARANGSLACP